MGEADRAHDQGHENHAQRDLVTSVQAILPHMRPSSWAPRIAADSIGKGNKKHVNIRGGCDGGGSVERRWGCARICRVFNAAGDGCKNAVSHSIGSLPVAENDMQLP